jgi:hypothetical protein
MIGGAGPFLIEQEASSLTVINDRNCIFTPKENDRNDI